MNAWLRAALITAAPWVVAGGFLMWPKIVPDSYWVSKISLEASNARVGEVPSVTFSRVINRSFSMAWAGEVRRKITVADGTGYIVACSSSGRTDHDPGPPDIFHVDLNWVVWPNHCDLLPGVYYISSQWRIDTPIGERTIHFRSNDFTVTP